MHAVWTSETAVNGVIPEFTPKPLCVGTYESDPETHFFCADFIDMVEDVVPPPDKYMAPVLALHSRTMGKSPTGKFWVPSQHRIRRHPAKQYLGIFVGIILDQGDEGGVRYGGARMWPS